MIRFKTTGRNTQITHQLYNKTYRQCFDLHRQMTDTHFLGWSVQTEKTTSRYNHHSHMTGAGGTHNHISDKITCRSFSFPFAMKSTFIPPMTTCRRNALWVLVWGGNEWNVWAIVFGACVFVLTMSDSESADCFPGRSLLFCGFSSSSCLDSATAILLPTLALLWIRAMSRKVTG